MAARQWHVIGDNYAIVDRKLYQTKCRSEGEAYYLLAIINSDELEMAAATFMTKGLYGARDFEKHGWKLPIPLYEARNSLHARLSRLGKAAEQECADIIADSDHRDQARRRLPVPRGPQPAAPRVATQQRNRPIH